MNAVGWSLPPLQHRQVAWNVSQWRTIWVLMRLMLGRFTPAVVLQLPLLAMQWLSPFESVFVFAPLAALGPLFVMHDDLVGLHGLPISARVVDTARLLSRVLLTVSPALALTIALQWKATRNTEPGFATVLLSFAFVTAVAPTVAAALFARRARWVHAVGGLVLGPAVLLVAVTIGSSQHDSTIAFVVAAALGGAALFVLHATPDVFLLAPRAADKGQIRTGNLDRRVGTMGQSPHARAFGWRDVLRLAWRSVDGPIVGTELVPLFVVAIASIGSSLGVPLLLIGSTGAHVLQMRFGWVNYLPIRAWARAAVLTVVPVVSVVLMLFVPSVPIRWMRSVRSPSHGAPDAVDAEGTDWSNRTRLPFALWQRTRHDGAVMTMEAPWGERVELFTVRVLGTTWYNPYSTRRDSSPRLVEMQWRRLSRALYGKELPMRLAQDDHFPPRILDRWPVQLVYGAMVLTLVLMMRSLAVLQASPCRRTQVMGWVGYVVVFATVIWDIQSQRVGGVLRPTFERFALAVSESLPTPFVPLVALMPAACAFAGLAWILSSREHAPSQMVVTPVRG